MKKIFRTALLPLFFCQGAYALDLDNPLPNWLDTSREAAKAVKSEPSDRATPADFRIPAEYEPVGAVVLGWAGYTPMLGSIVRAAANQGRAQVWAMSGPSSFQGVPAGSYTRLNIPLDTVWVRDYGPFGLSAGANRPGIVDAIYRHYQYRTDDDAAPAAIGSAKNISVFGMNIILDGGNLMVDSRGNLFMTKRTYIWNSNLTPAQVDNALKESLRVKNVITFDYAGYPGEPGDGTGHIDMFMKLLNDHTVLISLADTEPFKSNAEKALAYFKGRTAPDGQPYKVITVKGWQKNGAWYTYTNSLIVNNTVLMPSYSGAAAQESAAVAAYQQGMPGVTVVPINSDDSITAGGSIHCTTQTIPVLPARYVEAGRANPVPLPSSKLLEGLLDSVPALRQAGSF